MRHAMMTLAVVAVGLCASASAGHAQKHRPGIREVHKHHRFWISGGLGGGWEDANDAFGNRGRGGAGYLRLGGTPHPQALVGVELLGWGDGGAFSDVSRANVTVMTMVYPSFNGGWFLKGGFGAAGYERGFEDYGGIGLSLGSGFDFRIGGNFYLTPNVDYMVQLFENSTNGSLLFTLGATVH